MGSGIGSLQAMEKDGKKLNEKGPSQMCIRDSLLILTDYMMCEGRSLMDGQTALSGQKGEAHGRNIISCLLYTSRCV